ncbi:MAG: hypothetical protein P8Y99_00135 [Calditrichaceae bacterium]
MAKLFFFGVIIILTIYIITAVFLVSIFDFDESIIESLIISPIITTANISLAFWIIMRVSNRKGDDFNKVFLGSMGARFIGLAVIIFIVIKLLNIHKIGFLVSLFLLYFIFQFWEVIVVNKYLDKGKVS